LVADPPSLDGQGTTKTVFPPHGTVFMRTSHRSPALRQSPRKPLCRTRSGTRGSNPRGHERQRESPLDCRAASGLSRVGWRSEDGSLRSKMRESPLSAHFQAFLETQIDRWGRDFRLFQASSATTRGQTQQQRTERNGRERGSIFRRRFHRLENVSQLMELFVAQPA
jgi:hypothetical protein